MVVVKSLSFLLLFKIVVGDYNVLLNPGKRCVATSVQVGTCHTCICTTSGVYHCRSILKCDLKAFASPIGTKQCDPLHTYRHDTIACSCDEYGQWRSSKCKENFHRIKPKSNHHNPKIGTDIACTPGQFYVTDCNVCLCDNSEFLNLGSCTRRPCIHKYKVDGCLQGDVLRSENEICMCSNIRYFIDSLCFKVEDEVVQKVKADDLDKIIEIGSYWGVLGEDKCKPYYFYTIDCAKCQCSPRGLLTCDSEHCKRPPALNSEEDEILRNNKIGHLRPFRELKTWDSECEPGIMYRLKCNPCICNNNREPICTNMLCLEDLKLTINDLKKISYKTNETLSRRSSLPEIRVGDPCIPGQMYKLECNTCRCNLDRSLMCTKMACIDWRTYISTGGDKKALRTGEKSKKSPYLPKVQKGMLCKPGKIYRDRCRKCFCTDKRRIMCSTKKTKDTCTFDKHAHLPPIKTPEDIRPAVKPTEIQEVQALSSCAEKCESGKSYKVDCNFCVCMEDNNLVCQKKMCISYDDMHRIEAKEMSDKPCSGGITTDDCKKCECVDGKSKCQAIPHCTMDRELLSLRKEAQGELDPIKDKCQLNAVYRTDCNKCYCQPDGSLRCTQKTCLNYSQVKLLEKQRLYLEKHGL